MFASPSAPYSFIVSSGASAYPLKTDMDGTATAGSSDFITAAGIVVIGYLVEAHGSADGVLTLSDHGGTAGTDINIAVLTAVTSVKYVSCETKTPWTGIKAALTGTGLRVRVFFTTGR